MAIYTKKGDKGTTSLYHPTARENIRVSKDSRKIRAIGAIDEVNSFLGICNIHLRGNSRYIVIKIQETLFSIGAILAGADIVFDSKLIRNLEKQIDEFEGQLPPAKNFILPGGTITSSHLMYARALTRRAEREIVSLSKKGSVSADILRYINRLSDYLFLLSRKENRKEGSKEIIWKKRES